MTTKMVKNSSAEPRSRSNTTTRRLMPHMTNIGVSMRRRGTDSGPILRLDALSSSRFSAR